MKMTRLLALLLALLTCVSLFASCKKEPEPEPEPPAPEVTTLNVVTKSETKYVIVRNYNAGPEVIEAVKSIVLAFHDYLGVDVEVRECYTDRDESTIDVPVEREILVGITNRPESKILEGLRSEDYLIQVAGSKLVVGGSTDSGTLHAATALLTEYIYKQGNRFEVANKVPQNFSITSNGGLAYSARYSYSKCVIMDARIDSFNIYYPKADQTADSLTAANSIRDHISKETGYRLNVYKDTQSWSDYTILVGDTIYSDQALLRSLGKDEYHISLKQTEVTYEDGSKHPGATIQILYGADAAKAAMTAFQKQFLPALVETGEFVLNEEKVITNKN